MVSKDQAIGGVILIVCVLVAVFYVVTLFYPAWLNGIPGVNVSEGGVQFWIIAVPVFVAFVAIMGIGAWIGWTMATTPPPKPIEEITSEVETGKKTVEEKPSEAEPMKEEEAGKEEEKKPPERKRKNE
jgi:predicted DNA-binding transcriptional regulator